MDSNLLASPWTWLVSGGALFIVWLLLRNRLGDLLGLFKGRQPSSPPSPMPMPSNGDVSPLSAVSHWMALRTYCHDKPEACKTLAELWHHLEPPGPPEPQPVVAAAPASVLPKAITGGKS